MGIKDEFSGVLEQAGPDIEEIINEKENINNQAQESMDEIESMFSDLQKELDERIKEVYSVEVVDLDKDFLEDTKSSAAEEDVDDESVSVEDFIKVAVPKKAKEKAKSKVDVRAELDKLEEEILPQISLEASANEATEEEGFEKYLDKEKIARSAKEPGREASDVTMAEAAPEEIVEPAPEEIVKPAEVAEAEPVKPAEEILAEPQELSTVKLAEPVVAEPVKPIEPVPVKAAKPVHTEPAKPVQAHPVKPVDITPPRPESFYASDPAFEKPARTKFEPEIEKAKTPAAKEEPEVRIIPGGSSPVYEAAMEALDSDGKYTVRHSSKKEEGKKHPSFKEDLKKILNSKAFRYSVIIGVPLILLLILIRFIKKRI